MKLTKLHLALAIGAAIFTSPAIADTDSRNYRPTEFQTRVTTKEQAMKCCLPNEKVALACKDCKTASEKPGTDKKGIASWFKADSMHDCSGCGGKITATVAGAGKVRGSEYTHTCSKCGANSALVCSSHKKS